MISVVIPLRLSDMVYEGAERLGFILSSIPRERFEVVVVDYGSEPAQRTEILDCVSRFPHARVIRSETVGYPFSAGAARNLGAQYASHEVVMFHDVDCIATHRMYHKIADEAARRRLETNAYDFFTIPVPFLTFEGSEEYRRMRSDLTEEEVDVFFQSRILRGDSYFLKTMAYSGSTVVTNRRHFLAIGGNNSQFYGHGGEDFDVKHRLAAYSPIATRPLDYYLNTRDNQINEYVGFRAYFALYGIETLYKGIMLMHLWHPKREPTRQTTTSYSQTKRNFGLLKDLMKSFDDGKVQPDPLPDRSQSVKTLVLCKTNSAAMRSIRQALPYSGDFTIADETIYSGPDSFLRAFSAGGYDRLILLNPYGNEHRLSLFRAAREANIDFAVFDRGALPDSWFFDSGGFNADSTSYDRRIWDKPLSDEDEGFVTRYLNDLRSAPPLEANGPQKSAEYWRTALNVGPRKVLFIALQRPGDTTARYLAGELGNYANFLMLVAAVASSLDASQWLVVAKKHPLETAKPDLPGVQFVPFDANIQDMLDLADAVWVLNSGVGLLALANGKPVIASGQAFYSGPGLAVPAVSRDAVLNALTEKTAPDPNTLKRFVHYLVRDFYSFGETEYVERDQPDGSRFTASTAINFRQLNIFGQRVLLGYPPAPATYSSPLFASFGGDETMARAKSSRFVKGSKGKPLAVVVPPPSVRAKGLRARVIRPVVRTIGNDSDKRKFEQNPAGWFSDLQNPVLRGFGRAVFGKPRQ